LTIELWDIILQEEWVFYYQEWKMDKKMCDTKEFSSIIASAEQELGKHGVLSRVAVYGLLLLSYMIVYFTGGTQFAYLHIAYIPIILAGLLFSAWEVLLVTVILGILIGPLMPLNVEKGQSQALLSWSVRMGIFIAIGQVIAYFIHRRNVFRDLLMKANSKLRRSNESLETLVRERTQDLENANAELHKINEHRIELLHILCHDLKNSLGAIHSSLSLQKQVTLSDEDRVNMEKILLLSTEQGLEMIKLIREYEALELKKRELELKKTSLHNAVTESILIISNRIQEKSINIDNAVDTGSVVMVEPTSFIYSVLNNLLTNAIKFSYKGSTITIRSEVKNNQVQLSIQDNGVGMPEDLIGAVFDIHQKTTRNGTYGEVGTGFGMPLVKKFVEAYGGAISITSQTEQESPEEHGTEVAILLNSE
jgi:signal transduction histidine kinase